MSPSKSIGGEYGEVRAGIDINRLNTYLAANTPSVKTPVGVKQFKVSLLYLAIINCSSLTLDVSLAR